MVATTIVITVEQVLVGSNICSLTRTVTTAIALSKGKTICRWRWPSEQCWSG
jgi:ABC-type tungstate transport system substrate-binding protein